MARYAFDIETDGFLDVLTKVHCLVLQDLDTGKIISCTDNDPDAPTIMQGLGLLTTADFVVGHNIITFDIPALKKVYPDWKFMANVIVRDTLVLTRLIWPDIRDIDFRRLKKGDTSLPKQLIGRHSLAAWGYRIKLWKGDYDGGWDKWSKEMQDYCEQDVVVTTKLFETCSAKGIPHEASDTEHRVQEIIFRQIQHGIQFDVKAAEALTQKLLKRRTVLEEKLKEVFPPWEVKGVKFTPKVNNTKRGYVKGVETRKATKTIEFNPGSRHHIAGRLKAIHGWKPEEFTNDGSPKIDETVLSTLPYPEAPLLKEFFLVQKRLGTIAEGKGAWLKYEKAGRLHGGVNPLGAITGRMTHNAPNLANVPSTRAIYGKECRQMFKVAKGKKMVGADASSLEGCCLAGYLYRYDDGAYAKSVISGNAKDETDTHSLNAIALGLEPKKDYPNLPDKVGREVGKRWFYAMIYGAGDWKLGMYIKPLDTPKGKKVSAGKSSKSRFFKNFPAFGKLVKAVQKKVKAKGYIVGLDGRKLPVRSLHSALNTLLQSAGAIIMKKALVILDDDLQATGLVSGVHYEFVANVHDEWQIEVDEDKTELVGKLAVDSIRRAGLALGFACPLSGDFKVGNNWAETH